MTAICKYCDQPIVPLDEVNAFLDATVQDRETGYKVTKQLLRAKFAGRCDQIATCDAIDWRLRAKDLQAKIDGLPKKQVPAEALNELVRLERILVETEISVVPKLEPNMERFLELWFKYCAELIAAAQATRELKGCRCGRGCLPTPRGEGDVL